MIVKIGEIESKNGRSALTFEIADEEYSARGRLDLTALYYLMTNASTTKTGRAKRGPVTITRARRNMTNIRPQILRNSVPLSNRAQEQPDLGS